MPQTTIGSSVMVLNRYINLTFQVRGWYIGPKRHRQASHQNDQYEAWTNHHYEMQCQLPVSNSGFSSPFGVPQLPLSSLLLLYFYKQFLLPLIA